MVQLRDSSSDARARKRDIHLLADGQMQCSICPSSSRCETVERYDRIFGLETEYGVSVTGANTQYSAQEIASVMFAPIVAQSLSTNTFLPNGSRLYLDVGVHPEYATAEARDPADALAQDVAGEQVMRSLAGRAERELRAGGDEHARIHLFKNNVDCEGHSFGCHENYLLRRFVSLEVIERQLLPFLITRQIFSGAGRVVGNHIELSQRANYLDDQISSATTHMRPMINVRDEPHADAQCFRRLHVILGDSNRSQYATLLKLATTHLVLCVIEQAQRTGTPCEFESCAIDDMVQVNRAVSRDTSGAIATIPLLHPDRYWNSTLLSNVDTTTTRYTSFVSALQLQYRYLAIVERFVQNHDVLMRQALAKTDPYWICRQWRAILDALVAGDTSYSAYRLDWAAKRHILNAIADRTPLSDEQYVQLDMDYHDIAHGSLYPSLLKRGLLYEHIDHKQVQVAVEQAPQNTRAALRGAFVKRALDCGVKFSCDWTHCTMHTPERREVVLLDPFCADSTVQYRRLMKSM